MQTLRSREPAGVDALTYNDRDFNHIIDIPGTCCLYHKLGDFTNPLDVKTQYVTEVSLCMRKITFFYCAVLFLACQPPCPTVEGFDALGSWFVDNSYECCFGPGRYNDPCLPYP